MSQPKTLPVRLWHSPYNGGWIWFDRSRWRRVEGGWRVQNGSTWKGGPDPILWWCVFGFCGHIILQSWPWQQSPGDKRRGKS